MIFDSWMSCHMVDILIVNFRPSNLGLFGFPLQAHAREKKRREKRKQKKVRVILGGCGGGRGGAEPPARPGKPLAPHQVVHRLGRGSAERSVLEARAPGRLERSRLPPRAAPVLTASSPRKKMFLLAGASSLLGAYCFLLETHATHEREARSFRPAMFQRPVDTVALVRFLPSLASLVASPETELTFGRHFPRVLLLLSPALRFFSSHSPSAFSSSSSCPGELFLFQDW